MFIDCSTWSTSLSRKPESAVDVTTCITPSHAVYSAALGRYLIDEELLGCQAIWRTDAPSEDAFESMIQNGLAADLAGNGFTGTIAQASFIASLITCSAWRELKANAFTFATAEQPPNHEKSGAGKPKQKTAIPGQPALHEDTTTGDQLVSHQNSDAGKGRKRNFDGSFPSTKSMAKTLDSGALVPTRRVYGKTSLVSLVAAAKPPQKRRKGVGRGNHKGKGKKKMVSIWEKETIFEAYEKAVQDGVQKPIAHVAQLGLPGYFPGCLYASKWGTVRESQNWSLLCKTAPALCKKHKELPNSLRRIMMIEAVKHGNSTGTEARTHLPMPLQEVVDELVLQRIELGEEVNMAYVKNTIHFAVEIWNEVVVSIKDSFQKKQMDLIKRDDEKLAGMTPAELEQHCDALVSEGEKMLEPICLKQSEGAIL